MSRPLDVVHVVPYYPPHPGGMERVAERLVEGVGGHGVRASVVTTDSGGQLPGEDPERVRRLPAVEVAHTPVMRGLLRELRRTPDGAVVHVHVAHAFIPDLAVAVARRRGQPVLAHYHLDVDPSGPMGVLLKPYQRILLRRTLLRSDVVVVPTPDYADIVHDLYAVPRSRIRVLPNGTDFPVAATPRTAPGADGTPRTWRLVAVGRLNPQKQFGLLLQACAALRERHPELDWRLDVVGDGELRADLERDVDRLGLRERVTLGRGDLDRAQMQARYDEADLFVLATRKESFGIVFAEAMARGLPVVTTNAPGVRNVVVDGRTGVLAEPDPVAFADAVARVMTDPAAYARMSAAGLDEARRYTWESVCAAFADLYADLAAGRADAG